MTALQVLGWIWASPITALGYLAALVTGSWVDRVWKGTAICSAGRPALWIMAGPIGRLFTGGGTIGAFTWGDVVIVRPEYLHHTELLAHELEHVRQTRCIGIVFPVAYLVAGLVALVRTAPFAWRNWYWANPFEVAARDAAARGDQPWGFQ